jgi:DNA-binding SARP family transcriptional activator
VLGPVDLSVGGSRVPVTPHQLAFIVVLALADGHPVAASGVVDALWGESPPPGASATVEHLAASVRRALADAGADPDTVRADSSGYLLSTVEEPDLWTFDRLVTEARARSAAGWLAAAAESYVSALALWRGPALRDVTAAFADLEAARLEELRLCVLEERLDVDLKLARHTQVLEELTELVTLHPLRERLRAELMLALYRCDRISDALAVYDAVALHSDPGLRLRQMYFAVRSGHPSLQVPRNPGPRRSADAATPATEG